MNQKEKGFKEAFIDMLMKKKAPLFELIFIAFFTVFFFYIIVLASAVSIPFAFLDEFFFMFITVILIWIVYISYLWRVLKNVKERKK